MLAPQPQHLVLLLHGAETETSLHLDSCHLLVSHLKQTQELLPPMQGHLLDDRVEDDGRPAICVVISSGNWKERTINSQRTQGTQLLVLR